MCRDRLVRRSLTVVSHRVMRPLSVRPHTARASAAVSEALDRRRLTQQIAQHARSGQWQPALEGWASIVQSGQEDLISFNATLSACDKGRQWKLLWNLFHAMPERQITPDVISISCVLRSARHWHCAVELLAALSSSRLRPDVGCYRAAIWPCLKGLAWSMALHFSSELSSGGGTLGVGLQRGFLRSFCSISEWQRSLQWLQEPGDLPSLTELLGGVPHWSISLKVLEDMVGQRIYPDVVAYSAAIRSCEKVGAWQVACSLFWTMMRRPSLTPDVISFNSTISALEKGGQWQMAVDFFGKMWLWRAQPDVVSFNSTISAAEKAGRWPVALRLWASMPQVGLQPDVISWNALLSSCHKGLQWFLACQLLEKMPSPDIISYNSTVSAVAKAGEWHRAWQLYLEMQRTSLRPTRISFNSLLSSCEKEGQWQLAVHYLHTMRQAALHPDLRTATALIRSCAEQWQLALRFFQQLDEADRDCQKAMLSICEKVGQWQWALHLTT